MKIKNQYYAKTFYSRISKRILLFSFQLFFNQKFHTLPSSFFKRIFSAFYQTNLIFHIIEEMQNSHDFQIVEKRKIKTRKVKAWTEHEDRLLKKLCEEHPRQWGIISALIPDRNQNQCLHRYRRICQRGMNHTKNWSEDEDDMVQKLIKRVGKNWKLISEMLSTKTGKQIRERYINKLDPSIKKQPWTKEEDMMLIKCIKEFGSKWSEISKSLPGRPENMIKNRFYSYIKKNYEIRDKSNENTNTVCQQREQAILPIQQTIQTEQGFQIYQQVEIAVQVEEKLKTLENHQFKQNRVWSVQYKKDKTAQQIPRMPSIMELDQHTPALKEIHNIEMIDVRTFNHFSEHDLFYFLNGR